MSRAMLIVMKYGRIFGWALSDSVGLKTIIEMATVTRRDPNFLDRPFFLQNRSYRAKFSSSDTKMLGAQL